MRPVRILQAASLLALVTLSAGCHTTVGNYFRNRARDLGECFLAQTGLGVGLGADVKAAGLLHVDAGLSLYIPEGSIGWVYGEYRPGEGGGPFVHVNMDGDVGLILVHASFRSYDYEGSLHWCPGLLPALTSVESASLGGGGWIWSGEEGIGEQGVGSEFESTRKYYSAKWLIEHGPPWRRVRRKARIHVFDIEAGVFVGIVGARVGFSPGEFLDFLLGWVGIDIAGDDRPPPLPDADVYRPILESPLADPEEWRKAAQWALEANDPRCLEWFLHAMSHAQHEEDALESIVSMGDEAVQGLVNVATHPRSNPDPRESARRALEELLLRGNLSPSEESQARFALEKDD